MDKRETMTVTEAARYLGVDKETVRRMLRPDPNREPRLVGTKNPLTGYWRIDAESVRRLAEQAKAEGE